MIKTHKDYLAFYENYYLDILISLGGKEELEQLRPLLTDTTIYIDKI
jgi:hypothetical protein